MSHLSSRFVSRCTLPPHAVAVYERAARFSLARAMFVTAERFLKAALAVKSNLILGADEERFRLQGRLANLYRHMNRFTEANSLYRALIFERRKVLGPYHRDVALTFNNYGNLLYEVDDWIGARKA